jgi:hypothetical protein
MDGRSFTTYIFGSLEDSREKSMRFAAEAAQFGLTPEHLESARKWERITRHKMNPNCPTLGSREELIAQDILTNVLPD